MPASLPTFSRGLKLVRVGAYVMLIQLVVGIVTTFRLLGADTLQDTHKALEWLQYLLLVNAGATLAMCVGVARAIPELSRARISIRRLVVSAIGFAVATIALAWSYHLLSSFVDVLLHPDSSLTDIMSAAERLESSTLVVIVKDLGYAVGLIAVIGMVQQSAILNDQLALRDEAGSMVRALVVMLVADLFYQLTYGLGGAVGPIGVIGSLLVLAYWIYCHLRLARFTFNAAYFMNEPHNLPVATMLVRDTDAASTKQPTKPTARVSQPVARPSQPLPIARPSQPPAVARPPQSPPVARPSQPPPVARPPQPPPVARPSQTPPVAPPRDPSDPGEPRLLR